MKHQTLVERAAEVFDFQSMLRPPAAPAAAASPVVDAEVPLVPDFPLPEQPAAEPRIEVQARPAGTVVPVDRQRLAEAGFIVPGEHVTSLAEEFRLVKRQLLSAVERQGAASTETSRIVLIASGKPDEGKSFCAVNLALSLAGERGVEVLLVDGDYPKPDALALLGIAHGPGLVDALCDHEIDVEDLVIRTDLPGLSVLPAGRKVNDVPELLASPRSRAIWKSLIAADPRRIILIDSPPALMSSCANVLSSQVGQVLVVVRADQTIEADLRETIGLLSGGADVALLLNGAGAVVTGRKYGSYDGIGHDEQI